MRTFMYPAFVALTILLALSGCDTLTDAPDTGTPPGVEDVAVASFEATPNGDLALNAESLGAETSQTARKGGRSQFFSTTFDIRARKYRYAHAPAPWWRSTFPEGTTFTAEAEPEWRDVILYLVGWDQDGRYLGHYKRSEGRDPERFTFDADDFPGAYHVGVLVFNPGRVFSVEADLRLYYELPDDPEPVSFPTTVLTSKNSTSPYAGSLNAFGDHLRGQCTWYVYGRTVELARAGHLGAEAEDALHDGLWGRSGRHAKNWPSLVGGSWRYASDISTSQRRAGMIGVLDWGDEFGHVFFVEEVSADGRRYRFSEYNRAVSETYSGPSANGWRDFGDALGSLGEPRFYVLPTS